MDKPIIDFLDEHESMQDAENPTIPFCPICGSEFTYYMGTLGNTVYFRCMSCGMDIDGAEFDE